MNFFEVFFAFLLLILALFQIRRSLNTHGCDHCSGCSGSSGCSGCKADCASREKGQIPLLIKSGEPGSPSVNDRIVSK